MITSPQNDRVKLARSLAAGAKARRKAGLFILEGVRLINDALERGQSPAFILYDPKRIQPEAVPLAKRDALLAAAPALIDGISTAETPPGIIGVFPIVPPPLPNPLRRVLILDAMRDPGNLGAIARTAAAAGVEAVLLAPGCVDAYNPKALRGGMGAHFRIPLLEMDWAHISQTCAGLLVALAAMKAERAYDSVDWTQPWALIIGGEAQGASAAAEQLAALRVGIPMAAATESLNAAAAAAVILFEAARQQRAAQAQGSYPPRNSS
ncbi:MAG: RNA methyltransferase [Aggregatilineales bacterium]